MVEAVTHFFRFLRGFRGVILGTRTQFSRCLVIAPAVRSGDSSPYVGSVVV